MESQTVFFVLMAGVFLLLYLDSKNKLTRKVIGSFLIATGIFLISPIPGPSDMVAIPLFSTVTEMSAVNSLFNYYIFTVAIGIGLIWVGLKITGRDFKYVKNKLSKMF